MEQVKAPEKIYIHPDIGGREFLRPWLRRAANQESVEYIRKDAFIDKACDAYCKVCKMPNCRRNECEWLSDFKGYLQTI